MSLLVVYPPSLIGVNIFSEHLLVPLSVSKCHCLCLASSVEVLKLNEGPMEAGAGYNTRHTDTVANFFIMLFMVIFSTFVKSLWTTFQDECINYTFGLAFQDISLTQMTMTMEILWECWSQFCIAINIV